MNLERVWGSLENSKQVDKVIPLLTCTVFNNDINTISSIRTLFDSLSMDDIEELMDSVKEIPTFEMEMPRSDVFGEVEYSVYFDYFEAANIGNAPALIWQSSKQIRKKFI